jgi:hypothetical protein
MKILPADLSLRNADHEGHSSVRRAIQFDDNTVSPLRFLGSGCPEISR